MTEQLATLLKEQRSYAPPPLFRRQAHVTSSSIHRRGAKDRLNFWAVWARELEWIKPWRKVLDWKPPHAKWFVGGKLNGSANCLDRHVRTAARNKVALPWEGEPRDRRAISYWELYREVNRCANALKALGVRKGDRVAIYLPMIPEVAVAMLACARIGAPHSVVFGGFSAESLRDRINDAEAKVLITADLGYRRGQIVPLKRNADEALKQTPSVQHVVVVRRHGADAEDELAHMQAGRDHWYHELMADAGQNCKPAAVDAEDLLFILYTSGTTGKPKGIVHTTGGYLTQAQATTRWVFDLKDEDAFWCTADVGWVTGHSYIVYGPLALGATVVMYGGAPGWPDKDRFWAIVERYGVTVFYTAPTAIRAFVKWGRGIPRAPQPVIASTAGHRGRANQPRSVGLVSPAHRRQTMPHRGHVVADRDRRHHNHAPARCHDDEAGLGDGSVSRRTIHGDDQRYRDTYWSRYPGKYFTGDGAKRDKDGYFWILGRVDDVLNVAGHRIGPMEVESALVSHPAVAEAAVVGRTSPRRAAARSCAGCSRTSPRAAPWATSRRWWILRWWRC